MPTPSVNREARRDRRFVAVLTTLAAAVVAGLAVINVVRPSWALSASASAWDWFPSPASIWYPLAVVVLLGAAFARLWLSRASRHTPLGVIAVVTLAGCAVLLGASGFAPCAVSEVGWLGTATRTLGLFLGSFESDVVGPAALGPCQAPVPLGLQLGRLLAILATGATVAAAAALLMRRQIDRFWCRVLDDVDVVVGLDATTIPLVRALVRERQQAAVDDDGWSAAGGPAATRWHRTLRRYGPTPVVVVHSTDKDSLADVARSAGAVVFSAEPTDRSMLTMLLSSHGGEQIAVRRLFAVDPDHDVNLAVVRAAEEVLGAVESAEGAEGEHPSNRRFIPRIVARLDDPREAHDWRLLRINSPVTGAHESWFVDAFAIEDLLAQHLVREITSAVATHRVTHVIIAGDSALAVAILDELAWQRWAATSTGRDWSIDSATLVGPFSERTRTDWSAYLPPAARTFVVDHVVGEWEETTTETLRAHPGAAVIVTGPSDGSLLAQATRIARLHRVAVFAPDATTIGLGSLTKHLDGQGFHAVVRYGDTLLAPETEGTTVPEDSWTELARFCHNAYLLDHEPDGRRARMAWPASDSSRLPDFYRQDNLRQLRNLLANLPAASQGRWRWAPVATDSPRHCPPDTVVATLARLEHERWVALRLSLGWTAPPPGTAAGNTPAQRRAVAISQEATRLNPSLRAWNDGRPYLPTGHERETTWGEPDLSAASGIQEWNCQIVREAIDRLYQWGVTLEPVAERDLSVHASYRRIGIVDAVQLTEEWRWTTARGDAMVSQRGDWKVTGEDGHPRGVAASDFASTYEALGSRFRRRGTVQARRATQTEVVESKEGPAVAHPGMWILSDAIDNSWPVENTYFIASYEALSDVPEEQLDAQPV